MVDEHLDVVALRRAEPVAHHAVRPLLFVGGTMNLAWMGLVMVLMIVEKLPVGRRLTTPLGIALLIAATLVAASALPPF